MKTRAILDAVREMPPRLLLRVVMDCRGLGHYRAGSLKIMGFPAGWVDALSETREWANGERAVVVRDARIIGSLAKIFDVVPRDHVLYSADSGGYPWAQGRLIDYLCERIEADAD